MPSNPEEAAVQLRRKIANAAMVSLSTAVDLLRELSPRDRALAVVALMDDIRAQLDSLASVRADAVREMRESGLSVVSIANQLDVSRQQIHKLLQDNPSRLLARSRVPPASRKETVEHVQPMSPPRPSREVRRAFAESELRLAAQPIVSLEDRTVVGQELNVRWLLPGGGMIPTVELVQGIEAENLSGHLAEWVFLEACKQLGRGTLPRESKIHVNAPSSLPSVEAIQRSLNLYGVVPSQFVLEVSEPSIVYADITTLSSLIDDGMGLLLDDFGTGYSSLSTVRSLPLTAIKIDRSFVTSFETDRDREIIRAIVSFAVSSGLDAYAEGVETLSAAQFLVSIGCKNGEGLLFGKPELLPAEVTSQ